MDSEDESDHRFCNCPGGKRKAVHRQVKKEGVGKGCWFWACSRPNDKESCGFFVWDGPNPYKATKAAAEADNAVLSATTIPALADEIRSAGHALENVNVEARRTEYIRNALMSMGPELETRFEFYIRRYVHVHVRPACPCLFLPVHTGPVYAV